MVLECSHFFTAETLDGLMRMWEVYMMDGYGEFIELKDVSAELAQSIPCCSDCQCSVKQHVTQRYNCTINRAVIDEMSKQFLVSEQNELWVLKQQTKKLKQTLESHMKIMNLIRLLQTRISIMTFTLAMVLQIENMLKEQQEKSKGLQKAIQSFYKKFINKHQPVQKLHNATVHVVRHRPTNELIANLSLINTVSAVSRNCWVTFCAKMMQIKVKHIVLKNRFSIVQALKSVNSKTSIKISGEDSDQLAKPFFRLVRNSSRNAALRICSS